MICHIPTAGNEPGSSGVPGTVRDTKGEYAAIVATNGQVYIYKSPEPTEGFQLKNRKTGQVREITEKATGIFYC